MSFQTIWIPKVILTNILSQKSWSSRTILKYAQVVYKYCLFQPNGYGPPDEWGRYPKQSREMVLLNDLEDQMVKKNSVAQTEVATPWIHQHQSTSTHFLQGKTSQTESIATTTDHR